MFAVVQESYAIFGVGNTREEAVTNARQWVDDVSCLVDLPTRNPRVHGARWVAPITPALAAQVESSGGDLAWGELPDGTLCTLGEEAEALR